MKKLVPGSNFDGDHLGLKGLNIENAKCTNLRKTALKFSLLCEDFTSRIHVFIQMDQFKYIIIMIVYIYA